MKPLPRNVTRYSPSGNVIGSSTRSPVPVKRNGAGSGVEVGNGIELGGIFVAVGGKGVNVVVIVKLDVTVGGGFVAVGKGVLVGLGVSVDAARVNVSKAKYPNVPKRSFSPSAGSIVGISVSVPTPARPCPYFFCLLTLIGLGDITRPAIIRFADPCLLRLALRHHPTPSHKMEIFPTFCPQIGRLPSPNGKITGFHTIDHAMLDEIKRRIRGFVR